MDVSEKLKRKKKKFIFKKRDTLNYFTDGGCLLEDQKGAFGYGVYNNNYIVKAKGLNFKYGYKNIFEKEPPRITNNNCELLAIIWVLDILENYFKNKQDDKIKIINIFTDSTYCKDGFMSYMENWHRKGWNKEKGKLENKEFWQKLYYLKNESILNNKEINIIKIKGHVFSSLEKSKKAYLDCKKCDNIETMKLSKKFVEDFNKFKTRAGEVDLQDYLLFVIGNSLVDSKCSEVMNDNIINHSNVGLINLED